MPNAFKRITQRFIAGMIIAGLSLAFLGGCENDQTGYITKTFVSPSGEYQAEVVQVSFVVRGGADNYGPRGIFDSRSVNILADTDLETGEGLVIGPNEDASFEIKLTGTKEPEESFGDEMPRSLYLRIVEIGTGDNLTLQMEGSLPRTFASV